MSSFIEPHLFDIDVGYRSTIPLRFICSICSGIRVSIKVRLAELTVVIHVEIIHYKMAVNVEILFLIFVNFD